MEHKPTPKGRKKVYGKKAQGKGREMPTRGYVRMDGLLGGGVCGLRRVSPISRPALVGEFEKMVCKRCCVKGGMPMYRCRWENGAAGIGYAAQKKEKKDIPDSLIPEWLGLPCTVSPD